MQLEYLCCLTTANSWGSHAACLKRTVEGAAVCPGDGGVGPVGEGVQVEHEGPVGVDGQHVHRCWRTEWPPLNKKDSPKNFFLTASFCFKSNLPWTLDKKG